MDSRSPRWSSRPPKGRPRRRFQQDNEGSYDQNEAKFIGGAERARRNARKRQRMNGGAGFGPNQKRSKSGGGRNNNNGRRGTRVARIPKHIKPMDRFFASLFRSAVGEYLASNDSEAARTRLMADICGRAGLPLPAKLPSASINSHHFYSARASLVMEEARFILADALRKHKPHDPHGRMHDGPSSLRLRLVSGEEREKLGATVLTFEKKRPGDVFTTQELYDMRPGCCFQVVTKGKMERAEEETADFIPMTDSAAATDAANAPSVLASVVPVANQSEVASQLSLMVYHKLRLDPSYAEDLWLVRPLTTLISESRQFEGCTRAPNVAFLPKLLGWKDASHIQFDDSDDEDNYDCDDEEEKKCDDEALLSMEYSKDTLGHIGVALPQLNQTQERAAASFLASPTSTLTLVQGPPGTGKTTFTVACIIGCLFQSKGKEDDSPRRILVTAPTNKAITVLASRFLAALNGTSSFNVVMIGVEDKLVGDNDVHHSHWHDDDMTLPSTLRYIFVYTWVDNIGEAFQSMREGLSSTQSIRGLVAKARQLKEKLKSGIPKTYKECGAPDYVDALIRCLEQTEDLLAPSPSEAIQLIGNVVERLGHIDQSGATQELLATADIIFSTLTTAGISSMKRTRRVNDLFVDEAAAATEPEICIPFHLRPERMLAVGDPMQLPATIMSRHAANLGLNKSLHERLMFDCGKDHIMLDTQYRMKPDISTFPSKSFYGGKLMNGDNVMRFSYGEQAATPLRRPFTFFQTSGSERQYASASYCNSEEAHIVVEVVRMVRATAANRNNICSSGANWHSPDKIRVITFYQAQVSLIQRLLNKHGLGQVLVATVDSCQGCEADVVIVSFVRSNNKRGSVKNSVGFLTDDRRLNVALTRARYQLVCIGNATGTLSAVDGTTLAKMVDDAKERKCISCLDDDKSS